MGREQQEAEHVAAKIRTALETPRDLETQLSYPGVGELLLRLAWVPSFEPCLVWEVYHHNGVLSAYRSHGQVPGEPFVVGHQRLSLDDSALRGALDRLSAAGLSLRPALADIVVTDGERYIATIFSGFCTSGRISWIAGCEPTAWAPAVQVLVALRVLLDGSTSEFASSTLPSEIAHVYSEATSIGLVRLSTGEFHILSPGALGSLLCGPDYILAVTPVAEALRSACGADIVLRDARIRRKATNEACPSYVEVIPIAELKGADDLPLARLSGTRAWHYEHGNLFVNAEVRRVLLALALSDMSFSPGFARFAGHQAY